MNDRRERPLCLDCLAAAPDEPAFHALVFELDEGECSSCRRYGPVARGNRIPVDVEYQLSLFATG